VTAHPKLSNVKASARYIAHLIRHFQCVYYRTVNNRGFDTGKLEK
jgi:hypothetical protein